MVKKKIYNSIIILILSLGTCVIFIPFYLTVVSALKNMGELFDNFFGLPKVWVLDNFKYVLSRPDYFMALGNSCLITGTAIVFMVLLLPMCSYAISRRRFNSKFYNFLYFFMVAGIFIPFQVKMLPMVKLMSQIGLMNRQGAILLYIANSTCEGIFLLVGYLASMPTDLEEAAYIDGATTNQVFCKIVRPIMKPIISTVVIKNSLWIWNDYFMPSLVLNQSNTYRTLTLYQYSFKAENTTNFTVAFAVMVLSVLPIFIIYCIFQKKIVAGMMEGAVKG
ncbi:sugar ABC transporter permease [Clostridium sp. chh4-2]|uniref:carbohydrate ABC transporter permease n=1 Tax=Clostridium sp. chh4-2 TaxID=2067550 RepID=UPI000CCE0001|nr:carbohydrate ABC transporter permease [Clostridium sp. chh4-2]PNV60127.1 sugar ABC transporter permease [Clostridium sp. chh4-2]